jgi:hypothetical protein
MIVYKYMGPAVIEHLPCNPRAFLTDDLLKHFGFTPKEMDNWVQAGIFIRKEVPDNLPLSEQEFNMRLEADSTIKDNEAAELYNRYMQYLEVQVEPELENFADPTPVPSLREVVPQIVKKEKKSDQKANASGIADSQVNAHA